MSWQTYLFSFSGRINRAKLWLFVLVALGVEFVFMILGFAVFGVAGLSAAAGNRPAAALGGAALFFVLLGVLVVVGLVAASISLSIRRLHDRNKSGWWLMIFLALPFLLNTIGMANRIANDLHETNPVASLFTLIAFGFSIWAFVELYCLRGTDGANQYGPDPLNPTHQAQEFA